MDLNTAVKIKYEKNFQSNKDVSVKVIFPTTKDADGNDTVSIENKLIHIANKNLPTGTKYEIVADNVPPSDRTFRNAWEYETGSNEKTSEDLTAEELKKYNMKENL